MLAPLLLQRDSVESGVLLGHRADVVTGQMFP